MHPQPKPSQKTYPKSLLTANKSTLQNTQLGGQWKKTTHTAKLPYNILTAHSVKQLTPVDTRMPSPTLKEAGGGTQKFMESPLLQKCKSSTMDQNTAKTMGVFIKSKTRGGKPPLAAKRI